MPWGVLLSILGAFGTAALGGPVVSHALPTPTGEAVPEGQVGGSEGPTGAGLLVPRPPSTRAAVAAPAATVPLSLSGLGYPDGLSAAVSDPGVSARVRQTLPSDRAGDPGRSWMSPAPPARLLAASHLAGTPKRRIPEPASLLLLVTGLVGLLARRRLLRTRDVSR